MSVVMNSLKTYFGAVLVVFAVSSVVCNNDTNSSYSDLDLNEKEVRPLVKIYPEQSTIYAPSSKSLALTCVAFAEEDDVVTDIEWRDPSHKVIQKQISINSEGVKKLSKNILKLTFFRPQVRNSGDYTCSAVFSNNATIQAKVVVKFYDDIKFENCSQRQTLISGRSGEIICTISGNPFPQIIWLKNGSPITPHWKNTILPGKFIDALVTKLTGGLYTVEAFVLRTGQFKERTINVTVEDPPPPCSYSEFRCDNGFCIDRRRVCNGHNNCGDWSDEHNCPSTTRFRTTLLPCSYREYSCDNGKCINRNYVCDGDNDCGDWSDERGCVASKKQEWMINITYFDSTDNETYFESTDNGTYFRSTCPPGKFPCLNGNCVDEGRVCDGINDCGDWSDEEFCNKTSCASWQFNCTNGVCVERFLACNGKNDCGDWSDEMNYCDGRSLCPKGRFSCKDGSGCVDIRDLCDGIEDCRDGSDERRCRIILRSSCLPGTFVCKNGYCIAPEKVCNGKTDCYDGSDESNCGTNRNLCQLGMFACKNNRRCVSVRDICDGYNDCGDWSDETNCRITTTVSPACPRGKFTCLDGRCIPFNWLCDGYNDCFDGSDELRCRTHLSYGGVIGIVVACSVLIIVIIIAVVCFRKFRQEKTFGTVVRSQPLPTSIPLQALPQGCQSTPNPQQQPATTQQNGNVHSELGRHVQAITQTRIQQQQQQQSNLYPSLP